MYQFRALAVPDFMSRQAPPNYIAGLGRGASGFTTRGDLGSAIDDGSALAAAQAAAEGRGKRPVDDDDEADQYKDMENETGLFNTLPYEQDDEEADRIYEEVERKMDEKRKQKREAREKEELETFRKERPTIQQQFHDLKRGLSTITSDEWANIPEVQDMVRKRGDGKKVKDEVYGGRLTSVPDSILLSQMAQSQMATSIDASVQGLETPKIDVSQFGAARTKVVGLSLDKVSDSVSGQTTIDPKGYLTDLSSVAVKSDAEISDIKKARMLLRSVITTNPKHAPGWIAAARLEEVATKMSIAREIIAKGCEECPSSEDVWLEAARLNTPENAKIILANAIRHIPLSVKVWMQAKELETDPKAQKRVLRRALEYIPNSVALWKAAISMEEDPDDARILLARAVDCIPLSVELWLALARLETYTNAEKIMNKARKANPNSVEIWVAAAKLQEQNDRLDKGEIAIKKAVEKRFLDREQWIKEAESCEKEGFLGTLRSIIKWTIALDLEEDDYFDTWLEDAETCIKNGCTETARAIFQHALTIYPDDKVIWQDAAFLEKNHGTKSTLEAILIKALDKCPEAEVLWLLYAKEKWTGGDVDAAKAILRKAFDAIPESEEIWLAAIKLEIETKKFEEASRLLAEARIKANTSRVWMKSAILERLLGHYDLSLSILDQAIQAYPDFYKLWVIKGQIYQENMKDLIKAREHYAKAVKRLPNCSLLWILASRVEEQAGAPIKARAILEKARILNPKNADLWTEAVLVEKRGGNAAMAKALISKALQECSHSGALWCEMILLENRPQRKARSADALKHCENDPLVVCTVARLFWMDRKIDTARKWFQRAIKTNSDLGDTWAWWLKFEMQHGSSEQQKEVVDKFILAEPRHGVEWPKEMKKLENTGRKPQDVLAILVSRLEPSFEIDVSALEMREFGTKMINNMTFLSDHCNIIPVAKTENILSENNFSIRESSLPKTLLNEKSPETSFTERNSNEININFKVSSATTPSEGLETFGPAAADGDHPDTFENLEMEIPLSDPQEESLATVTGDSLDMVAGESAPIESLEMNSHFESIEMANIEFFNIESNFNRIAKILFDQKMKEIEMESESIRNGINPTLRQQILDLERNHQERLCDLKAHKQYQFDLIKKEREIELEQLKCRLDTVKRQIRRSFLDSTHSLMYKEIFASSFEELKEGQDPIYQYSLHPFYHKRQAIQDMNEIHYISSFGFPSANLWGLEDDEIECDVEALGLAKRRESQQETVEYIPIVNTQPCENLESDIQSDPLITSTDVKLSSGMTEIVINDSTINDDSKLEMTNGCNLSDTLLALKENAGFHDHQILLQQHVNNQNQPPALVSSNNMPCNILHLQNGDDCCLFDNGMKWNVKIVYIQDETVLVERQDGSQTTLTLQSLKDRQIFLISKS